MWTRDKKVSFCLNSQIPSLFCLFRELLVLKPRIFFRRVNVLVRAILRRTGSPSPPESPGYASTSSKKRYLTGIERKPTGLLAPVTTTVPPGNSLLCTVFPESLDLGSFILLLKHGVSSMSGANLPLDQRFPISTVGCTTSIGPGVWSIT
ncbi:hypothetical protein TNCT_412221 [Trichonephila clavata]|uniref:Uncharacterized protein n=1 Tax=Trichonephila clavata TaxID=2740835 RepID=A0A8X6IKV5_TRICU|nr:hypothetical protein TNCT_412221 [Trichonephila clavata]